MTKTQSLIENIGLNNLITIGILVVGLTVNFVALSAKVEHIGDKLQNEIVDRKVADEKLQLQIEKNWDENKSAHATIEGKLDVGVASIQESIQKLDETMSFHIGFHTGKGQ